VQLVANRAADVRERFMRVVYPDGEIEIDFLTHRVANSTARPLQALELRGQRLEASTEIVQLGLGR